MLHDTNKKIFFDSTTNNARPVSSAKKVLIELLRKTDLKYRHYKCSND